MFGIGGGEMIFILFIVLMLFGSDKIPDLARGLGKGMAQLRNATNDIKGEINKGMDDNGIRKSVEDITGNINNEISKARQNFLGDVPQQMSQIKQDVSADLSEPAVQTKASIDDLTGPIKRQK